MDHTINVILSLVLLFDFLILTFVRMASYWHMEIVTVTRLVRISYGDYELKTMRPGMVMEVQCKPVETQRNKGPLQKQTMEKRTSRDADGEEGSASPVQWVTYKRNF